MNNETVEITAINNNTLRMMKICRESAPGLFDPTKIVIGMIILSIGEKI